AALGQVLQPLVVVVHRDGKNFLRPILADDVLVEDVADLMRRRQVCLGRLARFVAGALFANDVVAQLDTFVADEHGRAGDELPYFVLALAAEGTIKKFFAAAFFRHYAARSLDARRLDPRGEDAVDQTILHGFGR